MMKLLRRDGGMQPTESVLLPAHSRGASPGVSTKAFLWDLSEMCFSLISNYLEAFGLVRTLTKNKKDDLHGKMVHVFLKTLQHAIKMS